MVFVKRKFIHTIQAFSLYTPSSVDRLYDEVGDERGEEKNGDR